MKKRIVALLLVIAMVIACLPILTFANDSNGSNKLMFELVNELEDNGEYIIVNKNQPGQPARVMESIGGNVLNYFDVSVDSNKRVIIDEDKAENCLVKAVQFNNNKQAKLQIGDKFIVKNNEDRLELSYNSTSSDVYNTYNYGGNDGWKLCGYGKWIRNTGNSTKQGETIRDGGWWAYSWEGTYTGAYLYKKVETATVTFDACGHGTTPEAQFLKKGDKATEPEVTPGEGYRFVCWLDGEKEWDFDTPVKEDITLTAKFDKLVEYVLTDELEDGEEYLIVNKNSKANSARVMQVINGTVLNYFESSVDSYNRIIVGEEEAENSVFSATNFFDDGLKKANLQIGDKYIGVNEEGRLVLVESNPGVFNTFNYGGSNGWKLCGYEFWIRNTGNTTGNRDGGWWPTDKFGSEYTGAYIYKKVNYEATVTADDITIDCTKNVPEFTALVIKDVKFPYVIEYEFNREENYTCGEYVIEVTGDKKQGNYTVTYVNGTLTINHVLEPVKGSEPTTIKDGYKKAFKCVGCGQYFEDEDGKVLIGDEEDYEAWKAKGGKGYLEKISSPDTGDNNNITLWIILTILGLTGIGAVGFYYLGLYKRFSFAEISQFFEKITKFSFFNKKK